MPAALLPADVIAAPMNSLSLARGSLSHRSDGSSARRLDVPPGDYRHLLRTNLALKHSNAANIRRFYSLSLPLDYF
jgi:hypothetical protein